MPKYCSLNGLFPKGCSVILAPEWLVSKLEENHVSLNCLLDGSLPNILSVDEIIYYYNYHRVPENYSKALTILTEVGNHSNCFKEPDFTYWEALSIERNRLMKIYDDPSYVSYAMSVIGPELNVTESNSNKGVELKTIRYGNNLIVTFGPSKETPDQFKAVEETFKYLSEFVPTDILLKTSLYAYLLLGPTKFRCE